MNPRAKQLLEHARAADALDANARERMLDGLTRKLAHGQLPLPEIDASPLVVSKASWLVKLSSSLAGKVGLSVLGALLIAAGAMLWRPEAQPPATVPPTSPPPIALEAHAPPAHAPAALESAPTAEPRAEPVKRRRRAASPRIEASPQPAASERARVTEPGPKPEAEPEPEARAPEQPPAPATTLDDELALLRRAYSELNAGRAARAFEVLDAHAERFPRGELEEAREVARMLALCAMGKEPAAKARARQFLATHPDSPFAGRVRGICAATKTP